MKIMGKRGGQRSGHTRTAIPFARVVTITAVRVTVILGLPVLDAFEANV